MQKKNKVSKYSLVLKKYILKLFKKPLEINDFKMGNSQDFASILIVLNNRLSLIEKVNQTPRQSFSKIKV